MENIPKKIYLQVDPENEKPEDFNELGEVTWCRDKINNNDIPYYRHGNNNPLDLLVIPKIAEDVRKLPMQEPRVETGVVEFGDDWKGVFLRGDDALAYGLVIDQVLQNKKHWINELQLNSLKKILFSCKESNFAH